MRTAIRREPGALSGTVDVTVSGSHLQLTILPAEHLTSEHSFANGSNRHDLSARQLNTGSTL